MSFLKAIDKDNKEVYINLDNVLYITKNDYKDKGKYIHYVALKEKRALNIESGTLEFMKDLKGELE